jgi:hypothetical protein
MPLLRHIDFDDIYFLTGPRTRVLSLRLDELTGPIPDGSGNCTVVLSWPAEWSFLDCRLQSGQGATATRFVTEGRDVLALLEQAGIPPEGRSQALEDGTRRAIAGAPPAAAEVTLTVTFNTDDPELPAWLEQAERDAHGLAFLHLYIEAYPGGKQPVARPIRLYPSPGENMKPYEGYVGIDLGNTNSTLVCLARHRTGVEEIDVVNVEGMDDGQLVPSALFITKYDAPPPGQADEHEIRAADWLYGRRAMQSTSGGWLVLGAKRLLADPHAQQPHLVWLNNRRVSIPKRSPAELFICSLFKSFYHRHQRIPRQLAVTYPATYSRREAEALKQTIFDAWVRSLGQERYSRDPAKRDKLIPVVIDEASAAALYFLYRDFVEAPGGLSVLRYIYPRELNLLLYDCGGGTTDIALVQARCSDDRTLAIEVLGRTGHRGFGGDDITSAVFRLLKAKLAVALQGLLKPPPPKKLVLPAETDQLASWLTANERLIDRLVPTRFEDERNNLEQEHVRNRIEATKNLWSHAELFKKDLGPDPKQPVKRKLGIASDSAFFKLLTKTHPTADRNQLQRVIAELEVRREEVDALIRPALDRSIDNANNMIRSKLPATSDVHWVYVVGNASRYPYVQQRLRERLRVCFLDGGLNGSAHGDGAARPAPGGLPPIARMRFDEDNLKNAVAKGAVFALSLEAGALGVGLSFDRHLIDRLPFDITYTDYKDGRHPTLYREHERYQDLTVRNIPVPPVKTPPGRSSFDPVDPSEENRRTEVYLERLWPGEAEPARFLHFHFENPIGSPTLQVRYDGENDPPCFFMKDELTGEEVEGKEIAAATYLSPVQSGKL